ncbi:MAG: hypothetical protein IMW97_05610 [Firmicutes bacterium]|nr:hypothetical protein [Candidatus Fermentithermobacillaceae bacterium]
MSRANPLDVACQLVRTAREEKPQDLREVAGVLALLNLLGIVDAFYGETAESAAGKPQRGAGAADETSPTGTLASATGSLPRVVTGELPALEVRRDQEVSEPVSGEVTGTPAGAATASPGTVFRATAPSSPGGAGETGPVAARLVSAEPSAQSAAGAARSPADAATSLLSSLIGLAGKDRGLDLKLVTSLIGLLARASGPKAASGEETSKGAGSEPDKDKASLAALFDPKFITLVLNLLAALNKPGGEVAGEGRRDGQSRSSTPAGGGTAAGVARGGSQPSGEAGESGSHVDRSSGEDLEVRVDSNGLARFEKPAISRSTPEAPRPASRLFPSPRQSRGHKPGHGILKSPFITPRRPSYLDEKG